MSTMSVVGTDGAYLVFSRPGRLGDRESRGERKMHYHLTTLICALAEVDMQSKHAFHGSPSPSSSVGQTEYDASNIPVLRGQRKLKRLGCATHRETSHLQNPGLGGSNPPRASRGSSSRVPCHLSPETRGSLFTHGQVLRGGLELSYFMAGSLTTTGMETRPDDSYGLGYIARIPSEEAAAGEKIAVNQAPGNIPEMPPQVAWADRTTHI